MNPTVGNVVVTLEAVNLCGRENGILFNEEELGKLREFENYIFEKLLRLKRPHMKGQVSSILIAPVRKTGQGMCRPLDDLCLTSDLGLIEHHAPCR